MPVNRNLWKRSLTKYYAPPWPCPRCNRGNLRLERERFWYRETADSQQHHDDDDFDPLDVEYVFSAVLRCDECDEAVGCCGVGRETRYEMQHPDGTWFDDYEPIFFPQCFTTPMLFMVLSKKVPEDVRSSLHKSFNLAFGDVGAAANYVRQAVEQLLTHKRVKRSDRKRKFISLGERIDLFRKKDKENADALDALRWIGNYGSHPESLAQSDLFDAYDILELVLEDLYVGHQRSVRNLVKHIVKAKKPGRPVKSAKRKRVKKPSKS